MMVLNESTDLTNYVGYDKKSALDVVMSWFAIRGNVATFFNIAGDVYEIRKIDGKFKYLAFKNKKKLFATSTKNALIARFYQYFNEVMK